MSSISENFLRFEGFFATLAGGTSSEKVAWVFFDLRGACDRLDLDFGLDLGGVDCFFISKYSREERVHQQTIQTPTGVGELRLER